MKRTINCPTCGNRNTLPAVSCLYCDTSLEDLSERSTVISAEIHAKASHVILTTAPSLEGYRILETIGIVSSECAFGMNLIEDLFVGLSDIFGGRSETSQQVLRAARVTCLRELKTEAAALDANAVIAVNLNYSEFSGKNKSMLFLVGTGTAVRVQRLDEPRV